MLLQATLTILPRLDHATLSYPLTDETLSWISQIRNKHNPNGRDVLIATNAVWNDYEPPSSMAWLEQLEGAMAREMPEFFNSNLQPGLFPRLFITSNAQGEAKPNVFHSFQNNIRLMRHERELALYASRRGYDHLGFYNLTVQASSKDGTHADWQNNIVKGMMVLNWLNMLDPPISAKQRPNIPSVSGEVADRPMPADLFKEVAPADVTALATMTHTATKYKTGNGKSVATASHSSASSHTSTPAALPASSTQGHPIEHLIKKADQDLKTLLSKETKTLNDTAAAYRARRGRHPPPNFDKWYAFAKSKDALMIEDFFDTLYDDLKPFWSVPASDMRRFPSAWPYVLKIRNGTVERWVGAGLCLRLAPVLTFARAMSRTMLLHGWNFG